MRDAQGKVTHRIVEASCHMVFGASIEAIPTRIVSAKVNFDLAPSLKAIPMPKELEGVTIVLKGGKKAIEMLSKIAQAVEAIQDPNIDPKERQILIEAIKAFAVKPEEEGGE